MPGNRSLFLISLSLLCVIGCVLVNNRGDNNDERTTSIETRLSAVATSVDREAQMILRNPDSITWHTLHNAFYLISQGEILAWSKNQFIPDFRTIIIPSDFQLSRSNSGDFLIKNWVTKDNNILIAVIPLVRKYPISNRYLFPEWDDEIFDGWRGYVLDISGEAGSLINLNDQAVFRFQFENGNSENGYGLFVLATLSLLFFLAGSYYFIKGLHRARRYEMVFISMSVIMVLLRIVMVTYEYPARWILPVVFDPQNFASSYYNSSIGDLFLNSIVVLILCGYVFFTYHKWHLTKLVLSLNGWSRYVTGCILIVISFFAFLYPFLFVETIFHNSSIQLDITDAIQFDSLRSLSWLSVLAGSISGFFFVHVFIKLSKAIFSTFLQFALALLMAGGVFAIYFVGTSRDYWITLPVAALFFAVLYLSDFTSSLRKLEPVMFIYFFVAISALGIQHGLSVKHFEEESRAESQFKFASDYLIGRDVLGEYLLSESIKRIGQDAFIQSRITNPFLTKSAIRQKIRQVYLNSYFDRYEARIYLYNSAGEPLDNNSPETLSVFTDRYRNTSYATEYEGIYFIQPSDIDSNKRYLSIIPVYRAEQIIGFVLIDLSLKRIIPQNVYPELLVDRRFTEFFENKDRSFSFIKEGKILSSFGTFNYDRDFDFSILDRIDFYKSGITSSGFFHTGIEDVSGQVAVITSPAYPFFYVLTNFSFFFVLCVLLLVIAMLVYGLVSMVRGYKMNYAARIQLYIYLAFSLPLFVATITTLNRVSRSAELELNQDFESNARHLAEGIISYVTDYFNQIISKEELENVLSDRAKITNSDITLYDRKGGYVASSQPLIVENQITSSLMNRQVWERITQEGASSMIVDERIGSLIFNNGYVTLKSPESGALLGILSVPFFNSANSLKDTQINVLSNFLTVFTIIFILFSFLSFYIVNSLTFPLRFITRILSRTTLSGINKPLEWKSNDEIGMMVSEYNKMVSNLEQSKIELARSQKESAWREIAKQVAHEIKNPLTPMKLTLQQMEYQLKTHKLDDERARASINTLLTQVDILNGIASSFSAFARMPAPILERIDLIPLLNKCVNLYSDYESGEVVFNSDLSAAYVMGDEQLLNRIFSNIILNGLQSGHGAKMMVRVEVKRDDSDYLIQISDNGKGMEQEMIEKIFIPYFSTKKSGSGLGLAISKQGIEQSGGEIWLDTKPDVGTTFYIKLPGVV